MLQRKSGSELARLRAESSAKFAEIGMRMVKEADIREVKPRKSLSGCAYVEERTIEAPWPTTTRKRLYILAHECGHVVLNHRGRKKPRYVEEYEAEQYAIETLRKHDVAVPADMLKRAKAYVARKIRQAEARGAKSIDSKIRAWSQS